MANGVKPAHETHTARRKVDKDNNRIIVLPPDGHGNLWNGSAK